MNISRFLSARAFIDELKMLSVFPGYLGTSFLEKFESLGLLFPRIRIHYPDEVARRFWLDDHTEYQSDSTLPIEQDGARWSGAMSLEEELFRWGNPRQYGITSHPLDDQAQHHREFIKFPSDEPFICHDQRRLQVGSNENPLLVNDIKITDYYTSWQLLLAAELADSGIHIYFDFTEKDALLSTYDLINENKIPQRSYKIINIDNNNACREINTFSSTLDAFVWFAEERYRLLRSFDSYFNQDKERLSPEEIARYEAGSFNLANGAAVKYHTTVEKIFEIIKFLAIRWSTWERKGRPLVADAYRALISLGITFLKYAFDKSFSDVRDNIGVVDGRFAPILDCIWPDWVSEQKKRTVSTLRGLEKFEKSKGEYFSIQDIEKYVDFLIHKDLHSFFWRIQSFEGHFFRGNEAAIAGIKSDLQGMAVVVEHIIVKLGARESDTQLFEKFKYLWRNNNDVYKIIKDTKYAGLVRNKEFAKDWPKLKEKINLLRVEEGGEIAADLIWAARLRGGVHNDLPENSPAELRELFMSLIRSAFFTFITISPMMNFEEESKN
jgi:hypothetical protein